MSVIKHQERSEKISRSRMFDTKTSNRPNLLINQDPINNKEQVRPKSLKVNHRQWYYPKYMTTWTSTPPMHGLFVCIFEEKSIHQISIVSKIIHPRYLYRASWLYHAYRPILVPLSRSINHLYTPTLILRPLGQSMVLTCSRSAMLMNFKCRKPKLYHWLLFRKSSKLCLAI